METINKVFIGVITSIIVAFISAWIDINSRIAILETQVQNDHQAIENTNRDITEIKSMLQDIQIKVTHLQDVKQDK